MKQNKGNRNNEGLESVSQAAKLAVIGGDYNTWRRSSDHCGWSCSRG